MAILYILYILHIIHSYIHTICGYIILIYIYMYVYGLSNQYPIMLITEFNYNFVGSIYTEPFY